MSSSSISIHAGLEHIQSEVAKAAIGCGRDPDEVTLIAVSKKKPVSAVLECIRAGGVHFGENYIQEAVEKIDAIGKDKAVWHFIGRLQTNKVRFAVPRFEYIHTVDSVKLGKEIDKQARKIGKRQNIFIQVNIAKESTKSGVDVRDVTALAEEISRLDHVFIQGLMCMPPYVADPEDARIYFKQLANIRDRIADLDMDAVDMRRLSMGMSHDFRVAIEEGATMVRVGTAIFGERS